MAGSARAKLAKTLTTGDVIVKKPTTKKKAAAAAADAPPKKRGRPAGSGKKAAKPKKAGKEAKADNPKAAPSVKLQIDPEKRSKFIELRDAFKVTQDRLTTAQGKHRNTCKTIKEAGFTVEQIKVALQVETPEGEAEFKSKVANQLLAARYVGADVGQQFELFMEPDRTPGVDRAFDEGVQCSMENRSAVPPYSPETEQYRRFMEGYHHDQAERLNKGIKKLDAKAKPAPDAENDMDDDTEQAEPAPKPELITKAQKDAAKAEKAQQVARDAGPPTGNVVAGPGNPGLSRSQVAAAKETAKATAEKYFKPKPNEAKETAH